LVVVGVMAAACGAHGSAVAPSAHVDDAPAPQRIVVLGDSLAVSPSAGEGFPAVLEARLRERGLPWTVVNAGVRGDTSAGGLRRLDALLAGKPEIVVLALGANDGLRGVDADVVTRNLSQIIDRATARGAKVLLCGMDAPPLHGWQYTLAFHQVFPDVAAKYHVPLVPFLLQGVALNPEMNGDDLIHPNAAGARQIAETVWPYLEPMLAPVTR